ncbi:hypothetical protein CMO88_04500 [Candidatus Woesearchaeota archaeon]|nr:hypothetical protein [Candidatus Woesearchaeota archaeon]|tara:strand:+ start:1977 stop:3530 length:1554 start_codon:yes stop_codon:yes gene_type:complete
MKVNNKNIRQEYRILYGDTGRKHYVFTRKFWEFIQKQLERNRFKTKRDLARYIARIVECNTHERTIEGWLYNNSKPIIVENFEKNRYTEKGCKHGFSYFCSLCRINKKNTKNCPVPLFWITERKGKLYVYEKYWKELKYQVDNPYKYGLLLSQLRQQINIDSRTVRYWRTNEELPKLFSKDEFSFSNHNLYFLGLLLSDGHIRNNGSNLSFTYQVGSSDIFQGYWYPQFIQRFFPIFKHKKRMSNSYIRLDKTLGKFLFSTNMSSVSPIFMKKSIQFGLIKKKNKSNVSGYIKNIPKKVLNTINGHHEYFQGVFDGDGCYALNRSSHINLATSPELDYTHFIDCLPLVPTSIRNTNNASPYFSGDNSHVYAITFAPESLHNLDQKYTADDIIKQLTFLIDSAQNSIRPDKVHKLIKIIKVISSENYGEYRNCLPIQKEIRDAALRTRLRDKTKLLEKRYPIKNNRYQPFMPKWAEGMCSKKEAWNFFSKKENLVFKVKNNDLTELDFSKGIPVDFEF